MNSDEKTPTDTKHKSLWARHLITGLVRVLGLWFIISSFRVMLDTNHLPSLSTKLIEAGIFLSLGVFFIWLGFRRLSDDLEE